MLDFWIEQPWWLRLGVAGVMMVAGVLIVLYVNIRLGFVLLGAGAVMLLIGGKSQSEKNGYRF